MIYRRLNADLTNKRRAINDRFNHCIFDAGYNMVYFVPAWDIISCCCQIDGKAGVIGMSARYSTFIMYRGLIICALDDWLQSEGAKHDFIVAHPHFSAQQFSNGQDAINAANAYKGKPNSLRRKANKSRQKTACL